MLVSFCLLISSLIVGIVFFNSKQEVPLKEKILLDIPNSLSLLEISDLLLKNNILKNKYNFILFNIFVGEHKNLKAGEYLFYPGISERDISILFICLYTNWKI